VRKASVSEEGNFAYEKKDLICKPKDYSIQGSLLLITRGFISGDELKNKIVYAEKAADSVFVCRELKDGTCIPKTEAPKPGDVIWSG
jgi:hypothetical protein